MRKFIIVTNICPENIDPEWTNYTLLVKKAVKNVVVEMKDILGVDVFIDFILDGNIEGDFQTYDNYLIQGTVLGVDANDFASASENFARRVKKNLNGNKTTIRYTEDREV